MLWPGLLLSPPQPYSNGLEYLESVADYTMAGGGSILNYRKVVIHDLDDLGYPHSRRPPYLNKDCHGMSYMYELFPAPKFFFILDCRLKQIGRTENWSFRLWSNKLWWSECRLVSPVLSGLRLWNWPFQLVLFHGQSWIPCKKNLSWLISRYSHWYQKTKGYSLFLPIQLIDLDLLPSGKLT